MKIIYSLVFLTASVCFGFSAAPPVVGTMPPSLVVPAANGGNGTLDGITEIAAASSCAKYSWIGRGKAPLGYIKGVALTFAKAVCNKNESDVILVSKARALPEAIADRYDVLSWYNSNYKRIGLNNDTAGVSTLKHVYTVLLGLGMRESSGAYCTGRDMAAGFSSSSTAEAGLFQSSWGAHVKSQELIKLFDKYSASSDGCFLSVFKEGAKCGAGDAKNWGTGDGQKFQALSKSCPAFATEYAAVLVRLSGGTKGEYGPLRTKAAELNSSCDGMLSIIQSYVEANPKLCVSLK